MFPTHFILHRHASDAAWYAMQLDADRTSPLVDLDRLRHYQRVFVAHLDGLRFGGEDSVDITRAQLDRWKGPGELFVCWQLAHALHHQGLTDTAWDFLVAHPQPHYFDAAATAMLWLSADTAAPALKRFMTSDDPLALCLALSAYGLWRTPPAQDSASLFRHKSSNVRAEACRLAGRVRQFAAIPLVYQALHDEQPMVREQAAVALLLCNEAPAALPELYAATLRHAERVEADEGSAAIRAEQRAQYLARLLGHALPFPCATPTLDTLAATLPPYLYLLTLAHHGDPRHGDRLIAAMQDSESTGRRETGGTGTTSALYKRRALWALCLMLGINPETENLLSATPSQSADWPRAPGLDQDTGLPEPDAVAVARWWQAYQARLCAPSHPTTTGLTSTAMVPTVPAPYLMGIPLHTPEAIVPLLAKGTQAQRFAASLHMIRTQRHALWLDTRAPVALQCQCISVHA